MSPISCICNHLSVSHSASKSNRSTVRFTPNNWLRLENSSNKSKEVNAALELYFGAKDYAKQKEKEFMVRQMLKLHPKMSFGELGLLNFDSWYEPDDDIYADFYDNPKNCL